jgi:hypothetical protein
MRTVNTNYDWANCPIRLTEEERQYPHGVLEDFFSCFHLQDIRAMLWDWLVAALSTESGQYNTGYARSNLIFVYEKLELFIEAVYQINRRTRKNEKRKRRKRQRPNA